MRKPRDGEEFTCPLFERIHPHVITDPRWSKILMDTVTSSIIDLRGAAARYAGATDYLFRERVDNALGETGLVLPFPKGMEDKKPSGTLVLLTGDLGVIVFDAQLYDGPKPPCVAGYMVLRIKNGNLQAYGDLWSHMCQQGPALMGPTGMSEDLRKQLSKTILFSQALLADALTHEDDEGPPPTMVGKIGPGD